MGARLHRVCVLAVVPIVCSLRVFVRAWCSARCVFACACSRSLAQVGDICTVSNGFGMLSVALAADDEQVV